MNGTVLITGAAGQLGTELARAAWPASLRPVAPPESSLDITDRDSVMRALEEHEPAVIVNGAAFTAVDAAETDEAGAARINDHAVGILAEAARDADALLVHLSTDFVFDGTAGRPYDEDDEPRPVSVYGRTKLAGERRALDAARSLVLRTSWLYSAHGTNFVRTMRRLAVERSRIGVVADQHGCPTAAADLAGTIVALLSGDREPRGLYHAAAPDGATWWDLAREAIDAMRPPPEAVVERLSTDGYPTAARRPADSRLSSARLARDFGLQLRPWRAALADVSAELNAAVLPLGVDR